MILQVKSFGFGAAFRVGRAARSHLARQTFGLLQQLLERMLECRASSLKTFDTGRVGEQLDRAPSSSPSARATSESFCA